MLCCRPVRPSCSLLLGCSPPPPAGAYAGASRRVRRLAARGLLKRAALKPGAIITPRDTWPRFDGGISMELLVGVWGGWVGEWMDEWGSGTAGCWWAAGGCGTVAVSLESPNAAEPSALLRPCGFPQ